MAVSGGPDSVALLRALLALREPGAGAVVIAHLNHQLRGSQSDADEEFVRQLYAELAGSIPEIHLRCERTDVGRRAAEMGRNLEETARQIRYAWLAGIACDAGLARVATGHTANDQAETVLHRLLRGTGIQGLRGIAARRPLDGNVELVRPLLTASRADVLAYLAQLGQPYREDQSNADPRRTRNRIRHELLPQLAREYNPRIVDVLTRLAEQTEEIHRHESAEAERLLTEAERPRAGSVLVLDCEILARAPRQRVRDVLRLCWTREGWPVGDLSYDHWDRVAELVLGTQTAVELPGLIRAQRRGKMLQLARWVPDAG